jgi:hypothetical protein
MTPALGPVGSFEQFASGAVTMTDVSDASVTDNQGLTYALSGDDPITAANDNREFFNGKFAA